MQPASSSYPTLGSGYKHSSHSIEYSPRLVRTEKNYYDSRASIPSGERMSTAAEELAIQLGMERSGKDPRQAGVFDDLFARNDSHVYIWQWTETGLRVPKGRNANAYETDAQGRKYWAREVLIGDKMVGEILVPEGRGRVAVEWDEVFGLPRVTDEIKFPHTPYTTHFWFNSNPGKDNKSSHQDVAVWRWSDWHHGEDAWCLDVYAYYARSDAGSNDGFRPVRGSLPEIEKEIAKISQTSPDDLEKDYGKMPLAEFRKKYKL